MTYGEFILSIPQITSLNTLSIKPLEGRVVIECNPSISHKIIAELLGSGAVNVNDNLDRELTEMGVLEILCQSDRIYNSKGLNNESNI